MDLLLATKNLHKIRELKALLKPLPFIEHVSSLLDFPHYHPPKEEGSSFEENATAKALDAARNLNKIVLADDSGLVVPALEGRPGIFSARFAGDNATDKENRKKLLTEMGAKKGLERAAYFECSLVFATPEGMCKSFKGIVEGLILPSERGKHGFGYDSLFIKYEYNQTFAELSEETKNKISHRAKAFEKLKTYLETLTALSL
jgi:XTP/dITP diphosphohydrolase